MQSDAPSVGNKIWENPEIGVNAAFVGNLSAYFVRQNSNYGITLNFGLAPSTYKDWRELKRAEKRRDFALANATMLRSWMASMQTRLSEIKLGLKDEALTDAEKQKLILEAFEIDKMATMFSNELGVAYAGQLQRITVSPGS